MNNTILHPPNNLPNEIITTPHDATPALHVPSITVLEEPPTATNELPPESISENLPFQFPLFALNDSQRRAVQAIARTYQQDPALSGMVSLAAIAAAAGKGFQIVGASPHKTFPNIYVVAAAPRTYGKGVSSSILSAILKENDLLQTTYKNETIPELKARKLIAEKQLQCLLKATPPHNKDIQEQQSLIESCSDRLKTSPALLVGSTTGAALVESLARNSEQLLSYSPEAGDMIHVALGRYSKDDRGDFDLFLSAYSGESFSESRIGRGSKHLSAPCLTACWLVQPTLLSEMLGSQEAIERGLAARFLYVSIPPQDIPLDDGKGLSLDPREMENWNLILTRTLTHRALNRTDEVKCDPEAKEIFRKFHNEMVERRNSDLKDIQGEFGRARENAIRLALGQFIADAMDANKEWTTLTVDHAERGVALARFSYNHFRQLLGPAREQIQKDRSKKLVEICEERGGSVSLRDLKNRNGFESAEVQLLATKFPRKFEIIRKPSSEKGGRPSELLSLRKK
jgi:hypothetical protein